MTDTYTYRHTESAAAFGTEYTIIMCYYNYLMNVIKQHTSVQRNVTHEVSLQLPWFHFIVMASSGFHCFPPLGAGNCSRYLELPMHAYPSLSRSLPLLHRMSCRTLYGRGGRRWGQHHTLVYPHMHMPCRGTHILALWDASDAWTFGNLHGPITRRHSACGLATQRCTCVRACSVLQSEV